MCNLTVFCKPVDDEMRLKTKSNEMRHSKRENVALSLTSWKL